MKLKTSLLLLILFISLACSTKKELPFKDAGKNILRIDFFNKIHFSFIYNNHAFSCSNLCQFQVNSNAVLQWIESLEKIELIEDKSKNISFASTAKAEIQFFYKNLRRDIKVIEEDEKYYVLIRDLDLQLGSIIRVKSGILTEEDFNLLVKKPAFFKLNPFRDLKITNILYNEVPLTEEKQKLVIDSFSKLKMEEVLFTGFVTKGELTYNSIAVFKNSNLKSSFLIKTEGPEFQFEVGRPSLQDEKITYWFSGSKEIYQDHYFSAWTRLKQALD